MDGWLGFNGILSAQVAAISSRTKSIGGGTGRGYAPQLSALAPPHLCDCDLVLHWCNSKIKQQQYIHKPHVTFYMRKLYLMAAPGLMFHFLESF